MRLLAHLLVLDITRTEPRYDGKSSLPQLSYYNEFLLLPLDIRLRNEVHKPRKQLDCTRELVAGAKLQKSYSVLHLLTALQLVATHDPHTCITSFRHSSWRE